MEKTATQGPIGTHYAQLLAASAARARLERGADSHRLSRYLKLEFRYGGMDGVRELSVRMTDFPEALEGHILNFGGYVQLDIRGHAARRRYVAVIGPCSPDFAGLLTRLGFSAERVAYDSSEVCADGAAEFLEAVRETIEGVR